MKAAKPRNRAAQDATLINLRALAKRVAKLEATVAKLTKPQPRDPRDDAYWRQLSRVLGKANLDFYRRLAGQK